MTRQALLALVLNSTPSFLFPSVWLASRSRFHTMKGVLMKKLAIVLLGMLALPSVLCRVLSSL